MRFVIALVLLIVILIVFADRVYPHEAPSGWSYPMNCCSGLDCREIKSSAIKEITQGYVILRTRELIRFSDPRLKNSPDGAYHWCSVRGEETTGTVCLFIPQPGS